MDVGVDLEDQQSLLVSQLKDLVRKKDEEVQDKIKELKVWFFIHVI